MSLSYRKSTSSRISALHQEISFSKYNNFISLSQIKNEQKIKFYSINAFSLHSLEIYLFPVIKNIIICKLLRGGDCFSVLIFLLKLSIILKNNSYQKRMKGLKQLIDQNSIHNTP